MADYYLCGWGQVLNAVVPAGARDKAGTRRADVHGGGAGGEVKPPANLPAKQAAVLNYLREVSKPVEMRELTRRVRCGPGPVEALASKGLARRVSRRMDRFVEAREETGEPDGPITLNADQMRGLVATGAGLAAGRFPGVSAARRHRQRQDGDLSRAIEEVVRQGKEALVMVPEISLTPQTIQRFRGRCGEVAVLHSHLGDAERGGHWRRVAAGQVQVIVGARSAVFAPARKLGLIVIDEEHENTFKQESTPRYHGRDVAVMRARLEEHPDHARLGDAVAGKLAQRPARPVHAVDAAATRAGSAVAAGGADRSAPRRAAPRPLPRTERRPGTCHARRPASDGGQVMLLLNRRGFSTHIHCPSCGHIESCRFCDLA